MKFAKNSLIGFVLIAVGVLLVFVVYSFETQVQAANAGICGMDPDVCPHARNIPLEAVLGYNISIVLVMVGIYLIISDQRAAKIKTVSAENWRKVTSALQGDEKTVYEIIASEDGVMFQSDIVEKSELQKVKVSRVLDRLEARNLLERRRRGMSNVVVLKNP